MRRVLSAVGLIVLWSVPGLLSASATLLLFPNSPTIGGNVRRYLIVSVAPWWIWVLLTPTVLLLARRFPIEDWRWRRIAIHVGAGVAAGLLYVLAAAVTSWAMMRISPPVFTSVPGVIIRAPAVPRPPEPLAEMYRGFISSRLPIGLIVYATLAGIGMAMEERRRRRARELDASRLETHLARAELQAIQMRLQPHFLFNTLHAISLLIEENPPAASRMIAQLGDLLRETLRLADAPEVPLAREIALLRQYLEIEQTRFGPRLNVAIDVDPGVEQVPVPSFLLQPIVENAIRHGVAPRLEAGRIGVRASADGGMLRMTVTDDGPGFGRRAGDPGIGLSATHERLALRYRGRAALRCETGAGGGAIVTVEIPLS